MFVYLILRENLKLPILTFNKRIPFRYSMIRRPVHLSYLPLVFEAEERRLTPHLRLPKIVADFGDLSALLFITCGPHK